MLQASAINGYMLQWMCLFVYLLSDGLNYLQNAIEQITSD